MHAASTVRTVSQSLCTLGAHLGHLRVESYQGLSYYVLGGRDLFIVFDLCKTVCALKSALVFFERMVSHYGTVLFCHSDISQFNLQLVDYISRLITIRNHSFSYLRWVSGCITNYRYVFLRLIELLFREARVTRKHKAAGLRMRLTNTYHSSFFSYYKQLWIWFSYHAKSSGYNAAPSARTLQWFHSFFLHHKKSVLTTYLFAVYKRRILPYELARHYSGIYARATLADIKSDVRDLLIDNDNRNRRTSRRISLRSGISMLRALPSFLSMLFRICYVLKNRTENIKIAYPNAKIDEEVLFRFLFARMHVFWRAIIFFRCFHKTTHLPDCLVMLNPANSVSEFHDFVGIRSPIICIADTNADIEWITYPIPSNDDSVILFIFYTLLFMESAEIAKHLRLVSL